MAGNLVNEDSISVQDLQDPSITSHAYTFKHAGSGHKRRRGSVQPSSSRAGKKSKSEIDRDYRERKKEGVERLNAEVERLNAEVEERKRSNSHLEGRVFELRELQVKTDENLKEAREEIFNLKNVQKSQSDSILQLEKELMASGEKNKALKGEHAQEINALKAKHAQEHEALMQFCSLWEIDVGKWLGNGAGEMNNPMETRPAAAQATTNF